MGELAPGRGAPAHLVVVAPGEAIAPFELDPEAIRIGPEDLVRAHLGQRLQLLV